MGGAAKVAEQVGVHVEHTVVPKCDRSRQKQVRWRGAVCVGGVVLCCGSPCHVSTCGRVCVWGGGAYSVPHHGVPSSVSPARPLHPPSNPTLSYIRRCTAGLKFGMLL